MQVLHEMMYSDCQKLSFCLMPKTPKSGLYVVRCANYFSQVFIFQGCTMVWFYELHCRETKFVAICHAVRRNELYTGLLYSGYVLSGTCWQKLTVEWHWLKFFRARFFCISASLISAAVKCVTNGWWTGQPSPTALTLNGFTRNAKHGFSSWKCSNQAWNSSSSLKNSF